MSIINNTSSLQTLLEQVNTLSTITLQSKTITPNTNEQIIVADDGYNGLDEVTVIGDSNLVAGNIAEGVSIFGVTGTHGGEGNTDVEDALVTRTLTTYVNNRVQTIGYGAFAQASILTSINAPACLSIDGSAFNSCSSLKTISFPECTNIGSWAFVSCTSLTTVSFPACTTIYDNAFRACSSLTTASFPVCTTISSFAFYMCRSLTTLSFPACTNIDDSAFRLCSILTTASFPACTTIGTLAFASCSKLKTLSFPACTTINQQAFASCPSLTTASFPVCTTISSFAFQKCSSLSIIYLTAPFVCSLANSNAFSSAGITSTAGSIYVPSSLVASYQAATNWAYFSNRIFSAP